MDEYPVGTRIQNMRTQGSNARKYGVVTHQTYDEVYVRYDDRSIGHTDEPERYYKIIERAESPRSNCNGSSCDVVDETPMKNIVNFVKNLALSSSEKLLRKYGLKNECGEYSQSAKEIVINKLCADNESTLVEYATAFEAEEKANKDN